MLALKLGNSLSGMGKTLPNTYSLRLNGTDTYVTADSVAADIDISKGAFSAWVQISTTSSSGTILHSRVDSNNLFNFFYHASSNELRFTYKAGGTTKYVFTTEEIEGDEKWHHVYATWSVAADEIKLYLDGELKGEQTNLGTWSGTPAVFDIGQNTTGSGYFKGYVTEVAMFDVIQPINSVYVTAQQPVDLTGLSGLKAYFKTNEGSGTSAFDSSGEGNTGTLINTPTWSTIVPYKAG